MTALQTLTTRQAELADKLEKARKAKKATAPIKVELAEVEALIAEAEKATAEAVAEKRPVGRPRKFSPKFYELRDALKATRRGRPTRQDTLDKLAVLDVTVQDVDTLSTRALEVILIAEAAIALYAAKHEVA